MLKSQFELLATYNYHMNQKICDSIKGLPEEDLWQDKKAFFGSILGTLNHLMVGDLIWLTRFNQHPNYPNGFNALQGLTDFDQPTGLNHPLCQSQTDYIAKRLALDEIIIGFIEALTEEDLRQALTYTNTKGVSFNRPFSQLLLHLFNHQTHHRGQVTTLLNQIGIDIGETDLLMLIEDIN